MITFDIAQQARGRRGLLCLHGLDGRVVEALLLQWGEGGRLQVITLIILLLLTLLLLITLITLIIILLLLIVIINDMWSWSDAQKIFSAPQRPKVIYFRFVVILCKSGRSLPRWWFCRTDQEVSGVPPDNFGCPIDQVDFASSSKSSYHSNHHHVLNPIPSNSKWSK